MFKYMLVLLLIPFVSFVLSADILAIIPTPSYSHQIAFTHIWRELSLRGHKVTVVTTDPIKDPSLVNLTEIDTKWSYKFVLPILKELTESMTMWNIQEILLDLSINSSEALLSHPPIQDLRVNRGDKNFDVVMVEYLNPELLAFGELYNCPTIIVSSLDTYSHIHESMGNPTNPVLWPEIGTTFSESLSFQERITSTVYSWYLSYFFAFKGYRARRRLLETYFNTTTTVEKLISNVDMLFLNVMPVLQGIRALSPTTVNIGGFRPMLTSTALPQEIQNFLDKASEGFIYFSLGSNVKSKDLPKPSLTAIFEALKQVPYKVLWKFETDNSPGESDNIKMIKWAPQQTVLSHPNIKLFVTQGGAQSMEEGIFAEIPFVVIPFFGDQEQNAKMMEGKGFAKIVARRPFIKKGELKNAILEVISNSTYKNAVMRIKQLVLDAPMSGIETAVWWTEYVIRHKGTKHLKNPTAELPSYQYYLLDVIGFLLFVVGFILWTTIRLAKICYRIILGKLIRSSESHNKKTVKIS